LATQNGFRGTRLINKLLIFRALTHMIVNTLHGFKGTYLGTLPPPNFIISSSSSSHDRLKLLCRLILLPTFTTLAVAKLIVGDSTRASRFKLNQLISAAPASTMEGIDNHWDELLHDSFQYSVDTLGHPESISALHAYDFELGTQFWGSQTVFLRS
jgi:hypothetical protein